MKQKILKLFLSLSLLVPLHTIIAHDSESDLSINTLSEVDGDTTEAHTRKSHCRTTAQTLKVCGLATIGNLQVRGNQTVAGNVTAGSDIVNGNQTVAGTLTFGNNLTVGGTVTTNGLIVNGVDLSGAVTDAANTCTTAGAIFIGEIGNTLYFKCLQAGNGISLTSDNNAITINATTTAVVTPVLTTTVTGGILEYASAYNLLSETVSTGAPVTFSNPGSHSTNITLPGVGGSAFTIPAGHPGVYYFEYHVRGTPGLTALVPPAPLVFQLLNGVTPIAASQFASDTQTTSLPNAASGGTLAVNGFVLAAIDASGGVITLENITGYDVILTATTSLLPAVNASLIIEKIA